MRFAISGSFHFDSSAIHSFSQSKRHSPFVCDRVADTVAGAPVDMVQIVASDLGLIAVDQLQQPQRQPLASEM